MVTLYKNTLTSASDRVVKNVPENVPENAPENAPENVPEKRLRVIMELIKSDTGISMLVLAKKIVVDHKTFKRDITKLKTRGLLKRIGPAKGGHWVVNEPESFRVNSEK